MRYEFEDFCLDADLQELRRGGVRVEVEPQVFDLLHHLVRHRDRVVGKDELVEHVWRGRVVSDSTLTSRIAFARKALGDDGGSQRLVRTLSRKGLRFVGEVREAGASPLPAAGAAPPDKPSIAVLPFDNMGGDAQAGFLADGIAEDILTTLAAWPSLSVIARNSSFSWRGTAVDLREVGRDLGVRYVLEGSLRQDKSRVRVTAQLIEAQTGHHVWAGRYDGEVTDLFAVQDEIARAVSVALVPAIADAEQQRARRRPAASLDSWGAYQRGMWHLSKANPADDELAGGFFRQAIERDPLFAGGYIGASAVLARRKGTQQAEESLARKAVELDGRNAEAHARLALALLARGAHGEAQAQARRALELCPNLAAAHGALGVVLAYAGQPREGVAALGECLRLDPRGPYLVNRLTQLALAHYFSRDYEAAAHAARQAAQAYPSFPSPYRWGAAALGQLGRADEARQMLAKAIALAPQEFDFQVRSRPAWFSAPAHDHMLEGLRKAGWAG